MLNPYPFRTPTIKPDRIVSVDSSPNKRQNKGAIAIAEGGQIQRFVSACGTEFLLRAAWSEALNKNFGSISAQSTVSNKTATTEGRSVS